MERITLSISGMSCGHCVMGVEKALRGLAGVEVEQVKIGSAAVAYDPAATSEDRIAQAIEGEGYAVTATAR